MLPRLAGAAQSPRGASKPAALRGRLGRDPHGRLKQQAAETAPAGPAIPALRHSPTPPLPLPAASPEVPLARPPQSSAAGAATWGAATLHTLEDHDAVLIGSTAPSFSLAAAALPASAASLPAAVPRPQPASPAALRRPSLKLGSDDLSLTALAAASRRGTWYSGGSAGSDARSLPSTAGSRTGSAACEPAIQPSAPAPAGPPAAEDGGYASDFEAESPGAAPLPRARPPAARLGSDELALLRASLLELGIGAGAGAGAGTGAGACAGQPVGGQAGGVSCGEAEVEDAIPDQMVLQELSSRLGRLDSAKRRVLLAVLAKIDGGLEGGSGAAPAAVASRHAGAPDASAVAAAASKLIVESLAASRRASGASSRADSMPRSPAPAPQVAAPLPVAAAPAPPPPLQPQRPLQQPPQQQAAPIAVAMQQSPSKQGGLMGKLAALRLGRSNSHGKPGGAAAGTAAAAEAATTAARSSVPVPLQPAARALKQPVVQLPAAARAPQPSGRQAHGQLSTTSERRLSQAGSAAATASGPAAEPSEGASDALAAFEQQLAASAPQEAQSPSLAASPTALVLHALEQQPDALDATGLQAPAPAAHASGSGGGSGGAGFAIPRCPSGRLLELRIHSTWGDPHYVGLCALELFDSRGQLLSVRCVRRGSALHTASQGRARVVAWLRRARSACTCCSSRLRLPHAAAPPQGPGAPGQCVPPLRQRPARLQRRPAHARQASGWCGADVRRSCKGHCGCCSQQTACTAA